MNTNRSGFTLVELTISIFISLIIMIGLSILMMRVTQNFSDTNMKNILFEQVKSFNIDTSMFLYNSGVVYTGGILLYNQKHGLLLGSFIDAYNGENYQFQYNPSIYESRYLGYFYIGESTLSGILNNSIQPETLFYNNGKIYPNLILQNIGITQYNTGNIFEMNIKVFKRYSPDMIGKMIQEYFVSESEIMKFNFNF